MVFERSNSSIIVDRHSLTRSKSGAIFGTIYFNIDGMCYPDNSWNDFVVTLLTSWIEEYEKFNSHGSTEMLFLFMDGPFEIQMRRVVPNLIHASLRRRTAKATMQEGEYLILNQDVASSLLDCANAIIAECVERRWDVSSLIKHRSILRSITDNLSNSP